MKADLYFGLKLFLAKYIFLFFFSPWPIFFVDIIFTNMEAIQIVCMKLFPWQTFFLYRSVSPIFELHFYEVYHWQ